VVRHGGRAPREGLRNTVEGAVFALGNESAAGACLRSRSFIAQWLAEPCEYLAQRSRGLNSLFRLLRQQLHHHS
ncbi:MAG: hypothetical protein JWL61_2447, partial [Gemmatimonadetes bacterium]|nr:hypothetical protein [Gemmatimonadota bacterium]